MDGFECPRCGQHVGNHQVHDAGACTAQQEINRQNLGIPCQWCGSKDVHKSGCPRVRRWAMAIPHWPLPQTNIFIDD